MMRPWIARAKLAPRLFQARFNSHNVPLSRLESFGEETISSNDIILQELEVNDEQIDRRSLYESEMYLHLRRRLEKELLYPKPAKSMELPVRTKLPQSTKPSPYKNIETQKFNKALHTKSSNIFKSLNKKVRSSHIIENSDQKSVQNSLKHVSEEELLLRYRLRRSLPRNRKLSIRIAPEITRKTRDLKPGSRGRGLPLSLEDSRFFILNMRVRLMKLSSSIYNPPHTKFLRKRSKQYQLYRMLSSFLSKGMIKARWKGKGFSTLLRLRILQRKHLANDHFQNFKHRFQFKVFLKSTLTSIRKTFYGFRYVIKPNKPQANILKWFDTVGAFRFSDATFWKKKHINISNKQLNIILRKFPEDFIGTFVKLMAAKFLINDNDANLIVRNATRILRNGSFYQKYVILRGEEPHRSIRLDESKLKRELRNTLLTERQLEVLSSQYSRELFREIFKYLSTKKQSDRLVQQYLLAYRINVAKRYKSLGYSEGRSRFMGIIYQNWVNLRKSSTVWAGNAEKPMTSTLGNRRIQNNYVFVKRRVFK